MAGPVITTGQLQKTGDRPIKPSTLFVGLTREVTFAGLPIFYLILLIGVTMIGFIMLKSFMYVAVVGGTGYITLRALAAHDPKLVSVWIVTLQSTGLTLSLIRGKGVMYNA